MPRVLVVDDEPDVREVLRRALSRWGYEVMEAGNGSDALEICAQASPDIVLLDVVMPVMDGFKALEKLRESPASSATPVVLVTTHPAVEGEPIAMSLGCQHYISKPFDLDVVQSTIKVALRESQAVSQGQQDRPAVGPPAAGEEAPPEEASSQKEVEPVGAPPLRPQPGLATSGGLRTGIELIDNELAGGITRQSLVLIEGTLAVGKSVLCHHLTYGSLLDNQPVTYISFEQSEETFVDQLASIGMWVLGYLQSGQLQARCFQDLSQEEYSDRAIATLSQLVREEPNQHQNIIVDSISNRSIHGQEQAIVDLFQLCKERCRSGKTVCVVAHSAILEEQIWLRLRPLLDTHIRLSLKPMGRNLVKTLEVLKLDNAEVQTGNRIAFDVQPEVGIVPTRISGFAG